MPCNEGEESESSGEEKPFQRSERNQSLRMRDELDAALERVRAERADLQTQVSDALSKLKRYNESKVEMSQKLADMMGFVRDLQKATGEAGTNDVKNIASFDLAEEYKHE
jgi:uncharacterized protein YlxW (UPF0749 family)